MWVAPLVLWVCLRIAAFIGKLFGHLLPLSLGLMRAAVLCLFVSFVAAGPFLSPRQTEEGNDGIRLAVKPVCGPLSGSTADVNAGIDLAKYKTIVSFGVSRQFLFMLHL